MNIFNENIKDKVLPDKTFGFDIDDVVGELMVLILDTVNKENNTSFSEKDILDRGFGGLFEGKSPDYLKDLIVSNGMYAKMPVIEETKKFINLIKNDYQIMFITARFNYPGIEDITKKWFEDN